MLYLTFTKALVRPVLAYGSEAWTTRKTDKKRLIELEMKFMRRTAGYPLLVHKRNKDTLERKI